MGFRVSPPADDTRMLPTKGPDSYGYGSYTYGAKHVTDQAEPELSTAQAKPKRRATAKV